MATQDGPLVGDLDEPLALDDGVRVLARGPHLQEDVLGRSSVDGTGLDEADQRGELRWLHATGLEVRV